MITTRPRLLPLLSILFIAGGACAPGIDEGPGSGYPVVDTGLSECFDASTATPCSATSEFPGQDGQVEGLSPAYRDNGDGTVTDLVTGLTWLQSPDLNGDGVIDAADKLSLFAARAAAAALETGGHDDWRLPSIKEQYSLIDFRGTDPSGDTGNDTSGMRPYLDTSVFDFGYGDTSAGERIIDAQFVSDTEYVSTTMGGDATVFGVNFADGRIKGYPSGPMPGQSGDKKFYVLFVRDNPEYGQNDLVELDDGIVEDRATGLFWQQADDGVARDWGEALRYCDELGLGGLEDWRLPDAKELQSIVDYTRSPSTSGGSAIDPLFGNSDAELYFWSSTTHLTSTPDRQGSRAAYLCFGRALGYMEMPPGSNDFQWIDVHGAGAQRSDPKSGDPADYPEGFGPQGDDIRIFNAVRCVR